MTISPDGKILAVGSGTSTASDGAPSTDFSIKLIDAHYGKSLRTLAGHADSVEPVAFSPDSRLFEILESIVVVEIC